MLTTHVMIQLFKTRAICRLDVYIFPSDGYTLNYVIATM